MGKHETGYARVERDLYPTPDWVVGALAELVDLRGLTVHESACGDRRMAKALLLAGCARVYTSDIVDYGTGQDETVDFLSAQPNLERPPDAIITNPPFGQGGRLATAFIEVGLTRIRRSGGLLALLLPADFDSAKTRARYFGDCPDFVAKIVLRKRIVWFQRDDGIREAPKENSAWFLWQRSLLRTHRPTRLRPTAPPICSGGSSITRDRDSMKEQIRPMCDTEHKFKDTNRHLVEVPDSFAIARWRRDADVTTICRCILGTLKFEPHTADTTALRRALEGVIEDASRRVTLQKQEGTTAATNPSLIANEES